jgi:transcriptional regulator with XRE-family HTH domain
MLTESSDYRRILDDFLIGDRRLVERMDLKIRVDTKAGGLGWAVERMAEVTSPQVSYAYQAGAPPNPSVGVWIVADKELSGIESTLVPILCKLIYYFLVGSSERIAFGLDREIGPDLRKIRRSLRQSRDSVAAEINVSRSQISLWEGGTSVSSDDIMYRWCRALGLVCPPKTALVRVVDFSPELLRFLQEDPNRLRSLTPEQFERFAAERLDRMGYEVTLTGATNRKDGGIDLIAVPKSASLGSVVIAGQMKHHRGDQKTGRDAVDRLLAWKDSYFGIGLLVTNTKFTNDAVWTAQRERNARFLRLRDFTDLKRWLQGQWGTEDDWREIPDRIELAPGVVVEIPKPRIKTDLDIFKR